MDHLIEALEKWKDDQIGRFPAIELVCPQCEKTFSTDFVLPKICPHCQTVLLQPRRGYERIVAAVAILVIAVAIPGGIYFLLLSLRSDPAVGKLVGSLLANKTLFFFVTLAIIFPFLRSAGAGISEAVGKLLRDAVGHETEKTGLGRFANRMSKCKSATPEMVQWVFCRQVVIKGPPYQAANKTSRFDYNEGELARDLESVDILLYLLSGGGLNRNSALYSGWKPSAGWIREMMRDSAALTMAAKRIHAVKRPSDEQRLNWLSRNFLDGAPEFKKELMSP